MAAAGFQESAEFLGGSRACHVAPALLQAQRWCKLMTPIYQMVPQPVLEKGYLSIGGWGIMPLWIVAGVSVAAAVFFSIGAKKRFAGRQVE